MDFDVVDVPEQGRFEARAPDRATVGIAAYRREPGAVVFTHTEVEPGHEGEGVGSTLVREALDQVRREGLAVRPECPFVAGWIERHPAYQDLVVDR